MNKLTLKDNAVYTVLLSLYVADPATSLASNLVLGPYFPGWLNIFLSLYYYLINIVNIKRSLQNYEVSL